MPPAGGSYRVRSGDSLGKIAAENDTTVGALLRLPDAVLAISPFDHLPQQPGNPVAWTPLLVELALAAALMAAGLVAYRRRDLG